MNFNEKYDIIESCLKRKGVRVMSMKIAKKILAGTLALMSTFTAVSAAPVEIEKPTDSSTAQKMKNRLLLPQKT